MFVKYTSTLLRPLATGFHHKNNQRQITVCPDLQSPLTSAATKISRAVMYRAKIMRAAA